MIQAVESGPIYAPEGFDPGAWIGGADSDDDILGCMDDTACNYNADYNE